MYAAIPNKNMLVNTSPMFLCHHDSVATEADCSSAEVSQHEGSVMAARGLSPELLCTSQAAALRLHLHHCCCWWSICGNTVAAPFVFIAASA